MKKVLVLNGSFCEKPIIEKAKEMGYYVVTTGNAPNLIGHQSADEYIPCDYSDKEAILQLVKENGIEGIISCANDFGVLTAAYVAEQMGWSGHDSYETAKLLHHKDQFKQYCYERGIPSPHSVSFSSEEEAMEYCRESEYPIIVKANDLTGGKGISRADDFDGAAGAVKNAFSMSRDRHILVEPFLKGVQQTFITFLVDGKVRYSTSCNCYSFVNPYLIQAETFPAMGIEKTEKELVQIIEGIARDLKLADGIFAFQYMVCDGKPYILEMMRRCFGNQLLTVLDAVTGVPWEELYIKAALGESCEGVRVQRPTYRYCGHYGIMGTKNGILESCQIAPEIENHVFLKIEMIQPGAKIENYQSERIAYLYYHYENPEEMNRMVPKFGDGIQIKIRDLEI